MQRASASIYGLPKILKNQFLSLQLKYWTVVWKKESSGYVYSLCFLNKSSRLHSSFASWFCQKVVSVLSFASQLISGKEPSPPSVPGTSSEPWELFPICSFLFFPSLTTSLAKDSTQAIDTHTSCVFVSRGHGGEKRPVWHTSLSSFSTFLFQTSSSTIARPSVIIETALPVP